MTKQQKILCIICRVLLVIPCLFMQYEKILMVWVSITRGCKPSVIRTKNNWEQRIYHSVNTNFLLAKTWKYLKVLGSFQYFWKYCYQIYFHRFKGLIDSYGRRCYRYRVVQRVQLVSDTKTCVLCNETTCPKRFTIWTCEELHGSSFSYHMEDFVLNL